MHIHDLDLCHYYNGPFDADNWAVPLRAVGWLEHPYHFPTGIAPTALVPKLSTLVEQMRQSFFHYQFRGVKSCSLCDASGLASPGPIWSQENLFIPGTGEVYLAPGGIVHYVEGTRICHPRPLCVGFYYALAATLRTTLAHYAMPTQVGNLRWALGCRSSLGGEARLTS